MLSTEPTPGKKKEVKKELRPFWGKYFKFDWRFGLFLLLVVCIPRFLLVLQASKSGNYGPIGAIMLVSATIPFIFLNKYGRHSIGIKAPKNWKAAMPSFAMGIALGLLLYFIGKELYGNTFQNWYAYIGRSYNIPKIISAQDKRILFMIIGATGMLFSPIGEEFFFRGVVHGGFTKSIGERKASYVDSLAFAVTHIAHFGLLFLNDKWIFYFVPTVIWVVGMFVVSLVFFQMKRVAESLLGAVLCHAGFNLGMIYSIFYLL